MIMCQLVVLDKRPVFGSVGIRETLQRALTMLVFQVIDNQVRVSCSNLQLCAGLEAVIEGAMHAVRQQH